MDPNIKADTEIDVDVDVAVAVAPAKKGQAAPSSFLVFIRRWWLASLVAVVVVLGLVVYLENHRPRSTVYVANATGADGVTIFVDGEVVAQDLLDRAAKRVSLEAGKHELVAKDAAGTTIDAKTIDLAPTNHGDLDRSTYLYAPKRADSRCFFVVVSHYGEFGAPPVPDEFRKLDTALDLWLIDQPVDDWLSPSPYTHTSREKTDTRTSVRLAACDQTDFSR